ncbi:MAG: DUF697 domain-containing protein, partial [Vulcanococcus sp.]
MTPLPLTPLQPLAAGTLAALKRHWPAVAVVGGGVLLVDSLHGPLSSLLSLSAAAGGLWLLSGRLRPSPLSLPASSEGWLERLEGMLQAFDRLDGVPDTAALPAAEHPAQERRRRELLQLQERQGRRHLELALVGAAGWSDALQSALLASCRSPLPLRVHRSHPLPPAAGAWEWPEVFQRCDHLIVRLDLPLKAADLRWLEAVPQGQDVWLLVDRPEGDDGDGQWLALQQQLPEALRERAWLWTSQRLDGLAEELAPLMQQLAAGALLQPERTQLRSLKSLHTRWQVELEVVRRRRWQQLQQQTQWTVAAGVMVAPLPSLDLLVLAAANGLMLREMARLWDCPWSLEQLQAAATQLARAALSLGVVEWSSQALASLVKLHAATWLVGGALQALSAAYLTRVVGRAMADYLALAAGVPEAELEALLQRQAP